MDDNLEELFSRHHSNNAGFCRHYLTLYSMVLGMETKSAFEFGSGFSTKTILQALKLTKGSLVTCDNRPLNETAIFYDKETILHFDNWTYLQKDSSLILNDIKDKTFDFVLHDGAHKCNIVDKDIKAIIPRMKTGGLFLLHDTAHPTANYNLIKSVEELNWFKHDCITLPYGYGLTIIVVKEDFGNGKVEIKWTKTI
jgi:predicted O-methyltransferase YrrM